MKFDSFRQLRLLPDAAREPRVPHAAFIGSTLVLLTLAVAIATRNGWLLIALPFIGYGFAWVGHFGFEKNKPASFGHPAWSFASDWVMWGQMLTGKVPFSGTLAAA